MRKTKSLIASAMAGAAMLAVAVVFSLNASAQAGELEPGDGANLDCRCGLIWGTGCSASNHGNGCLPAGGVDCHTYDKNCS